MPSKLIPLVAALFSGLAMAVQGGMNSALGKITGLLQAVLIVHGTATVVVAAALFFIRPGYAGFGRMAHVPWYLFLGGVLGVLITYGVAASIPRVGASVATTAIIVGQVSTAMLVDHFGLFGLDSVPFTWTQLVGLALLAVGARLMLR